MRPRRPVRDLADPRQLPAAVFSRATVMRAGSCRCRSAIDRIRGGQRRREQRRLPRSGVASRIASRSSAKPMSSISSASSSTSTRTLEVERPAPDVVERPARRGDDDSAPRFERTDLLLHRRAAVDRHDAQPGAARVLVNRLGHLHRELARRHEHEAAACAGPAGGSSSRRWIIGSANAAVLPVPVAACASRSRPARSSGNRLALDRRRLFVAERGDGAHEVPARPNATKPRLPDALRGDVMRPFWCTRGDARQAVTDGTPTSGAGARWVRRLLAGLRWPQTPFLEPGHTDLPSRRPPRSGRPERLDGRLQRSDRDRGAFRDE